MAESTNTNWPADPYLTSLFVLEIGGIWEAEFSQCTGLQSETEVVSVEEGGENNFAHKLRGRNKNPPLVLKHGISKMSPALWAWREAMIHRLVPPMLNGAVILLDDQKQEVARWSFRNAAPVKWQGPALKAGDNALAIETLELSHDGLTVSAK